MIKLINFKQNQSLLDFFESKQDVLSKFSIGDLFFIYFEKDSLKNRLDLRRILSNHSPINVIILSNDDLNKLAWKTNVLHFFQTSENIKKQFDNLVEKLYFINNLKKLPKKIKVNYLGGSDIIDLDNILYCRAEGNYTTLFMIDFKKKTYTIQLNKLNDLLSKHHNISRVGKSILINYKYISQIKSEEIVFTINEKQTVLKLSNLLIKRIKKEIIWY